MDKDIVQGWSIVFKPDEADATSIVIEGVMWPVVRLEDGMYVTFHKNNGAQRLRLPERWQSRDHLHVVAVSAPWGSRSTIEGI
jgi:hypothetical protein